MKAATAMRYARNRTIDLIKSAGDNSQFSDNLSPVKGQKFKLNFNTASKKDILLSPEVRTPSQFVKAAPSEASAYTQINVRSPRKEKRIQMAL